MDSKKKENILIPEIDKKQKKVRNLKLEWGVFFFVVVFFSNDLFPRIQIFVSSQN